MQQKVLLTSWQVLSKITSAKAAGSHRRRLPIAPLDLCCPCSLQLQPQATACTGAGRRIAQHNLLALCTRICANMIMAAWQHKAPIDAANLVLDS